MKPDEPPFTPEEHCEVLATIQELGHDFTVGTIVVFKRFAFDAHNGVTRFWFTKDGDDRLNVWHVWDTDPPASVQWVKYFKKVDQRT